MASMIEICNLALGCLGEPPIADLNEKRPAARYCKLYLRIALESLLRDHPWNFAQARERLTPAAMPDAWAETYSLAYVLPARCVRLHHLVNARGERESRFALTDHEGRTLVLTHLEGAIAAFTRMTDDAGQFDALFSQALARKLAVLLARPLTKSGGQLMQELEAMLQRELENARTQDAREGRQAQDAASAWNGGHDLWADVVCRECGA